MAEEGYNFYYTPINTWLSHSLRKIHKQGGKAILLTEYIRNKEQSANDIINRLEKVNNDIEGWN